MKQIVFNYVDPKVRAIAVNYGDMDSDGFHPSDFDEFLSELPSDVASLIHSEPIFGDASYLLPDDFGDFSISVQPWVHSILYYPNVLVFNLIDSDHGTKEEE